MERKELIARLDEMSKNTKESQPHAAVVILALLGALCEGTEAELVKKVSEFTEERIRSMNERDARLN